MNTPILSELSTAPLMIASSGRQELEQIIAQATKSSTKPVEARSLTMWAEEMAKTIASEGRVAVLPIVGTMTKYARFDFSSDNLEYIVPGIDDIASLLDMIDESKNYDGTILLINTPGGSIWSWVRIEEVLRSRKKPVVAFVEGICASAGMYVASFCDKIFAAHPICMFGSIGVMTTIADTSQLEKEAGIKYIEVYPPESKWKNLAEREAAKGNTEILINDELSPIAKHVQQTIRANRQNLDESVEGLLEGRMFLAQEAKAAGLIDEICTLDDAINFIINS